MENTELLIDSLLNDLNQTKRATKGRDTSKYYHKITISVSQADKDAIKLYAKGKEKTVSMIIKDLLRDNNIIRSQ